jgi:hypothetical protein
MDVAGSTPGSSDATSASFSTAAANVQASRRFGRRPDAAMRTGRDERDQHGANEAIGRPASR